MPSSRGGDRLLVIVSEHVSEWIAKGEVVDRYYNPGDRFAEVHLLLTNDDDVDREPLQRLVGAAEPVVHHLPTDRRLFATSLGWRPSLLRSWANGAVRIAREVEPALVRCYGVHLNGLCGVAIREALGIPLVASLHTLPDDPVHPRPPWLWARAEDLSIRSARATAIRRADAVIAVYASLVPYLEHAGARRIVLAYNVLNARALRVKPGYALGDPPSAISVGRLIPGKDPRPIVEAVAAIDGLRLTIVGDGPLRPDVERAVAAQGLGERVRVVPMAANDELLATLADHDVFVARNDYDGLPKAVLEPMLAGLPVIVNRPPAVAELTDERVLAVEPSADAFRSAIELLIADEPMRTRLGSAARAWAEANADPPRVEERIVALYDELIAGR